jgi:hypothetical protein
VQLVDDHLIGDQSSPTTLDLGVTWERIVTNDVCFEATFLVPSAFTYTLLRLQLVRIPNWYNLRRRVREVLRHPALVLVHLTHSTIRDQAQALASRQSNHADVLNFVHINSERTISNMAFSSSSMDTSDNDDGESASGSNDGIHTVRRVFNQHEEGGGSNFVDGMDSTTRRAGSHEASSSVVDGIAPTRRSFREESSSQASSSIVDGISPTRRSLREESSGSRGVDSMQMDRRNCPHHDLTPWSWTIPMPPPWRIGGSYAMQLCSQDAAHSQPISFHLVHAVTSQRTRVTIISSVLMESCWEVTVAVPSMTPYMGYMLQVEFEHDAVYFSQFISVDVALDGPDASGECAICYEPLDLGVVQTPCMHRFHAACLEKSRQFRPECPMCRSRI